MLDVFAVRARFPGLEREVAGHPAVFLDGPAGSQVPREVADAVAEHLVQVNANTHGPFETSRLSDALVDDARRACADLLGTDDPDTIAFGANMTSLTFALSRALGRTWGPGDEVIVTDLDHDANITPWVLAVRDAGATVLRVPFHTHDGTLDLEALDHALGPQTRLVAVGAASNALGTVNPVREVVRRAHAVGAEVFVDAVHYAPHRRVDVAAWGCDWLACSAYKFFGPHVGLLWGRRERLQELEAYRVRPAGEALPDKWSTGTQNFEGIRGVHAAIGYLASLGGEAPSRRAALDEAFAEIRAHEDALARALLGVFARLRGVKVWGLADPERLDDRVATFGITVDGVPSGEVAARLGAEGIFVWPGHFYAVEVTKRLGLEPHGLVRLGALHYNTVDEVDRVGRALGRIAG